MYKTYAVSLLLALSLLLLTGCAAFLSDDTVPQAESNQYVSPTVSAQTETPQAPDDTQPESSGISDLFDVFISCARYEQSPTLEDVKSILATSGYEGSDFTQNDENGFIVLDNDLKGAWFSGSLTDDGQLDTLYYDLNADGDYVSVRFLDEGCIYTVIQGGVKLNVRSIDELISYAADCLGIFVWS